jgi:hypothetical protein
MGNVDIYVLLVWPNMETTCLNNYYLLSIKQCTAYLYIVGVVFEIRFDHFFFSKKISCVARNNMCTSTLILQTKHTLIFGQNTQSLAFLKQIIIKYIIQH